MYEIKNKEFIKAYDDICYRHDRLRVFSDFVKMCAISIYNAFAHNKAMEEDYLRTIKAYNKNEQELFTKMFSELIMMYQETKEVTDILGPIYMSTKSKDKHLGQVFTPKHVSELMAEIMLGEKDSFKKDIEEKGFIRLMDPACGSGGLILSYVNILKKHNINYQKNLLVYVTDISDICVYMAYIQLSLYGIPAIVQCGDSLSQKMRFEMETPFYFLQYWKFMNVYNPKDNNKDKKEDIIETPVIENQNLFKEVIIKGNNQLVLW